MRFWPFLGILLVMTARAMEQTYQVKPLVSLCISVLSGNVAALEQNEQGFNFGDCPDKLQYEILKLVLADPDKYTHLEAESLIKWTSYNIKQIKQTEKGILDYISRPQLQQLARLYVNQKIKNNLTPDLITEIANMVYLEGAVRFKIATEIKDEYSLDLKARIRLFTKIGFRELHNRNDERLKALISIITKKLYGCEANETDDHIRYAIAFDDPNEKAEYKRKFYLELKKYDVAKHGRTEYNTIIHNCICSLTIDLNKKLSSYRVDVLDEKMRPVMLV